MSRAVRAREDAFSYVGSFFLEDEDLIFRQWLPRYYYFCVRTLFRFPAYASLFVLSFLVFPSQKIFFSLWLAYGAAFVIKAFVIRCLCSNLLVVTQRAVYIYFHYNEERLDELCWKDVQTVTFRTWRFCPSLATVNLRKGNPAEQIRSTLEKMYIFHTRYKRVGTLEYRELMLKKPYTVRLVVRNHGELYERCKQLQQTEGYTFLLKRKGKPYAQRKTDPAGTGK